jgi:uncharacterized protein YbaA (DUF1428 family)
LPVPNKNLTAYRRMAQKPGKVWREHGALEFRECVGDDLKTKMAASFPATIKLKPGEAVIFSWIMFRSRAHRESSAILPIASRFMVTITCEVTETCQPTLWFNRCFVPLCERRFSSHIF